MAAVLSGFEGYQNKEFIYKSVNGLDLKLDVLFPSKKPSSPPPVLIHYHGGFLVIGDRYTFFPSWLAQACVNRGWIFVTPDYRLLPETTAHDSVQDAVDAYEWVQRSLSTHLEIGVGPVVLAGSSAGGYLALTTSSLTKIRPAATLLIYGMLDPANKHYLAKGSNIFGQPSFDTSSIVEHLNSIKEQENPRVLTGYPFPSNPVTDIRMKIVSAWHIDALFPDYLTGVSGLAEKIRENGVQAVPLEHRSLFPLDFGSFDLPPTLILHGQNDSAVPVTLSQVAEERLRKHGVVVHSEFPADGEHGFDTRLGSVDLEKDKGEESQAPCYQSIRSLLSELDKIV